MATLEHIATGRIFVPNARAVLGRARTADLICDDERVSGEHAALIFADNAWVVRDLGSRNGTFLEDSRVTPGTDASLQVGHVLALGAVERWQILDLDPPDSVSRTIALAPTVEARRGSPTLKDVALRIGHSADEEYIEVHATIGSTTTLLAERAFHDVLLLLARERFSTASLAPAEQGWVYFDDLCTMLGRERTRVNVDVFRARQQLAELGVDRAVDLFERRTTTRQIRLGVTQVVVSAL